MCAALAACTLSNIEITQSATGVSVHGKPEYEVVVSNNCICSQSSLLLASKGFQTIERIDSSIFLQTGDTASINNGQPVFQGHPIKFKYAWGNKFDLKPYSSQINCS